MLMSAPERNILSRIMEDVNSQGSSLISKAVQVKAKAYSARMEDGRLVLYGKNVLDDKTWIQVNVFPGNGAIGECSAYKVTIEIAYNPRKCLKMTFYDPAHLPRHMVARSHYIPLEGVGRLREKLYNSQIWLWLQATFD